MIALVSTAAGTVLLVGAKAGFGSTADPATTPLADGRPQGGPSGSAPPAGGPAAPPGATPDGGPAAPGATTAPAAPGTGKTTAPATKPTTKAPVTPPKSTTMKNGTFTGDAAITDYGLVEVRITVSAGKLTATALDYPQDTDRSRSLSSRAIPALNRMAASANSASIDSVSGATYTSDGYRQSLQSAIDKALGG